MSRYIPLQPGIPRSLRDAIVYREYAPHDPRIAEVVHCFWLLSTPATLDAQFEYLVLPDCCIDCVFDLSDPPLVHDLLLITPGATSVRLPLGNSFCYIGIRFHPGMWPNWYDTSAQQIVDSVNGVYIQRPDLAAIIKIWRSAKDQSIRFVEAYITTMLTPTMPKPQSVQPILDDLFFGLSIEATARRSGYSARQLRRVIRARTGFSPVFLLRILRFHQALQVLQTATYADIYYDQSHYIRDFRAITGMTPRQFYAYYDLEGVLHDRNIQ